MIAGGVGITPMMSMVRAAADRRDPRPHRLVVVARNHEDLLFREELGYLLEQSGSRLLLVDPALAAPFDALPAQPKQVVPLRDAPGSLLERAREGAIPELTTTVADTDLVQLLYTSGTTSRPKGAMMTHRALLAEYTSCIVALEYAEEDRVLASLPLYHSAQMHCFSMPQLLMGAAITLIEAPEPGRVLELI